MQIKIAKPEDRKIYYVTSVEYTLKDDTKNVAEHITLAVSSEDGLINTSLVLFPSGRTAPFFERYKKGLAKATAKAKEANPDAPAILKIDDEEELLEAFPKTRIGDPTMFNFGAKLNVELDKPMYQVWRNNMTDVTVGYENGDLTKPIKKSVKAGEFILDPATGQKKVVTHVEFFVVYVSKEGEATADIANYADVWNNATRTLRPMPNEVSQMSVATEQQAEQSAEQQAINNAPNPFAK